MGFLTNFFLQPWMLAGTALVSVPIIIYLIQRHRYRRRPWAAMEFLLRAVKRHQRRIQLQNLLLLVVRCLIIAFLALAMARPVLRQAGFVAGSSENQNWLLALDTSFSMDYRVEGTSRFDAARESILAMYGTLIHPGDRVALVTFEAQPRVVMPPTFVDEDAYPLQLRRELEDLRLSAESVDLGSSFAQLVETSGEFAATVGGGGAVGAVPKHVVVFSDLQRKDWITEDGPRHPALGRLAEQVNEQGGQFFLAEFGVDEEPVNVAVTDLSIHPPQLGEDVWAEIRVTVRNFSAKDLENLDLTIEVDADPDAEDAEPQLGGVVRVPAGGTVSRSMRYRFATPGDHTIVARLRSDGLELDNERYLIAPVKKELSVLLVDGEPTADPTERETFHLEVALLPEDDSLSNVEGRWTPFVPRYVLPEQLDEVAWEDHILVILANVSALGEGSIASLKEYVRDGGALAVFLGPNVDPQLYAQLFSEDDAPGLLPFRLGEVRGDRRFPVHLAASDLSHPVVRYFEERREATMLHRPLISFYKYFSLAEPPREDSGARTLFRYTDIDQTPAVLDVPYGRGRVFWFNSTADQAWNDLSDWPDFVVLLYESASYLVRFGAEATNLGVGDYYRRAYTAENYASEVTLTMPEWDGIAGAERARTINKVMRRDSIESDESNESAPDAGGGDSGGDGRGVDGEAAEGFEIVHDDTSVPGVYRVDLRRPHTPIEDSVEYFCVNVSTEESDLSPLRDGDIATHVPDFEYKVLDISRRADEIASEENAMRGREYWKWFLAIVLALLVTESVLAWLFGRRSV